MKIRRIGVLGAGTMGHSIAQVALVSGYEVAIYDIAQELLENASTTIGGNIEKRYVAKGKLTQEQGKIIFDNLNCSTNLETVAGQADLIIEAIPENIDLKKKLFSQLDNFCPKEAILATNTSVLPVTAIAGSTSRPEKCIGMHFFNPAAVMKLVEVILPVGVSQETVAITMEFCQSLGKVPVKVKDIPGFIVNRLLMRLYQEAAQIVLEGTATPEEVDTAMKLGAGHPMGPCELADFGGFDVIQMAQDAIFNYTHQERDSLNILYRKMIEAGRLGRKNNKGFYDYANDGTQKAFKLF